MQRLLLPLLAALALMTEANAGISDSEIKVLGCRRGFKDASRSIEIKCKEF